MLDASLIFDGTPPNTGVAVTATATSTNVLDMLTARDVGAGDNLELHCAILQNFTAAGAATLQIALQTSPDNASFVDVLLSPILAKTDLVVGAAVFRYKVPPLTLNDTGSPNRYLRLNYTVATGPMTAGKVFSYLTGNGDRQVFYAYPRGYSIAA